MLLVRFTAEDLRIIERAKSAPEKEGALTLVNDRIAQSKVLKEFGKSPTVKAQTYGWQLAFKTAKDILGEAVIKPPFPDYRWYQRINGTLREQGFDDDKMRELAEYAKAHLLGRRKTISFDFMVSQHRRILDGEFDTGGAKDAATLQSPRMGPELPEE